MSNDYAYLPQAKLFQLTNDTGYINIYSFSLSHFLVTVQFGFVLFTIARIFFQSRTRDDANFESPTINLRLSGSSHLSHTQRL